MLLEQYFHDGTKNASHSEGLDKIYFGCACGVMVIVIGNEHDNTSLNPGRGCLHLT